MHYMLEASVQQYADEPHFRCPVCRTEVRFALQLRSIRSTVQMPTERGRPGEQTAASLVEGSRASRTPACDGVSAATSCTHATRAAPSHGRLRDDAARRTVGDAQAAGGQSDASSQSGGVDKLVLSPGWECRLRSRGAMLVYTNRLEAEMKRRSWLEAVHAQAAIDATRETGMPGARLRDSVAANREGGAASEVSERKKRKVARSG